MSQSGVFWVQRSLLDGKLGFAIIARGIPDSFYLIETAGGQPFCFPFLKGSRSIGVGRLVVLL